MALGVLMVRALILCIAFALPATAQQSQSAVGGTPAPSSDLDDGRPLHVAKFDRTADHALLAMEKRAHELGIQGVAIVAYFDGDSVRSWASKMIVVGSGIEDQPAQNQKVSNLLAVAYSKASEMADTLKNSGSHVRPPLTGEFGWNGGAIARGKHGYLVAAFSGGKGDQDFSVSTAGIAEMKKGL
jgi:hypothetical protein